MFGKLTTERMRDAQDGIFLWINLFIGDRYYFYPPGYCNGNRFLDFYSSAGSFRPIVILGDTGTL